jgi:hypothetical protein
MRYLKTYEEKEYQFWKIPLKLPDFLICLKKAGMPDERYEHFKHLHKNNVFFKKRWYDSEYDKSVTHIILVRHPDGAFTWDDAYESNVPKMKITQEDIQDWKDMEAAKLAAKKYNL